MLIAGTLSIEILGILIGRARTLDPRSWYTKPCPVYMQPTLSSRNQYKYAIVALNLPNTICFVLNQSISASGASLVHTCHNCNTDSRVSALSQIYHLVCLVTLRTTKLIDGQIEKSFRNIRQLSAHQLRMMVATFVKLDSEQKVKKKHTTLHTQLMNQFEFEIATLNISTKHFNRTFFQVSSAICSNQLKC